MKDPTWRTKNIELITILVAGVFSEPNNRNEQISIFKHPIEGTSYIYSRIIHWKL